MVNDVKSDWVPVVSGVLQGTVLGPFLFSLCINDISVNDCICCRDIKIERDILKLQKDIDKLRQMGYEWGMRLKPIKCKIMQLTIQRSIKIQANYTLDGTLSENVDSIKCLGITNTNDLRWNIHISNVCKMTNRNLRFLRSLFSRCERSSVFIKDWCGRSWNMEAQFGTLTLITFR